MVSLSIDKNKILLLWGPFLIITGSILFDLLNGFIQLVLNNDFSIGVLYRGVILMLLLPYILKKRTLFFYAFIFILFFFLISNYVWLLSQPFYNSFFEIKMLSRSLYLYVITSFFIYCHKTLGIKKLLQFVVWFGVLGGSAIIFSFFTGIGLDTYGDYSFGVKSFFPAQNDTSLALLLSLVITIYIFLKKRKVLHFIYALIITAGCFFLGTRAGMGGSIMVWVSVVFGLLLFKFRDVSLTKFTKAVVFLSFLIVLFIGASFALRILVENQYLLNKFTVEALVGGHARGWLAEAGQRIISESNFLEFLFGHGKFAHSLKINYLGEMNYNELSQAEVDHLDYIGSYGLFLGSIFLLIPLWFLFKSILNFYNERSLFNFSLVLGFTIYIGHSFYAGHAINSPIVSTVFSVYIFSVYKLSKDYSQKKKIRI